MRKVIIIFLAALFLGTNAWAGGQTRTAPEVRYISPSSEATVNLKDEEMLKFTWKSNPIPSGGRMNYKFELYRDYGYEMIENRTLDPYTFEVDVPSDKFQDGGTYTWQVRQRSARTKEWSKDYRWSFTVKK